MPGHDDDQVGFVGENLLQDRNQPIACIGHATAVDHLMLRVGSTCVQLDLEPFGKGRWRFIGMTEHCRAAKAKDAKGVRGFLP